MKLFAAMLFAVALTSTPASAFSMAIDLPILTFPETVVATTRACTDPGQVSGQICAATE